MTNVFEVLLEDTVGTFLVVRDDVLVPLGLEPVANTKLITISVSTAPRRERRTQDANLVFNSAEETGFLPSSLATLVKNSENLMAKVSR